MNILVFSWRDPKHPLAGGAEQVMHQHMMGWIAAGHKVTLFTSRFKNSIQEDNIDGVNIIRQGYQYLGVQLMGLIYYLRNKNNIDFVVDQFHGLPFFTPLYSKKPKVAVIQETAREVWFFNPLPIPLKWLVGLLGYAFEPLLFLFYRNVPFITGSLSAKKDIEKFGIPSKNIHVINHGVLLSSPKHLSPKEKIPTICFLGILSKDKGIEDALYTFQILNKLGSFQFWVIGRFETEKYHQKITDLVNKLDLNNKVKFFGHVSQEQKFELLARSHILINPSVREGWGLVNIEANSVGTPVVAYRSPGLVDSVKDGQSGIICFQNNPQDLASSIDNLLKNKSSYFKLQKSSVSWSGNFTWEKSQTLSLDLIKNITNDKL